MHSTLKVAQKILISAQVSYRKKLVHKPTRYNSFFSSEKKAIQIQAAVHCLYDSVAELQATGWALSTTSLFQQDELHQ